MASYILAVIGYPASESNGTYEWSLAGARSQQLAAGRGTITGSGHPTPWRSSGSRITPCLPASRLFW